MASATEGTTPAPNSPPFLPIDIWGVKHKELWYCFEGSGRQMSHADFSRPELITTWQEALFMVWQDVLVERQQPS